MKKDENYYLKVFLKEIKYIEEKVIRNIMDDLESSSDDYDKEQIKAMSLMCFEKAILKNTFFENVFFEGPIWEMSL